MRTLFGWKLLLPVFQSLVAIGLWLYTPVQYRIEVLRLTHRPVEHSFRLRFEGASRVFPPKSEQLLYVINFPAVAVSRGLVDPASTTFVAFLLAGAVSDAGTALHFWRSTTMYHDFHMLLLLAKVMLPMAVLAGALATAGGRLLPA